MLYSHYPLAGSMVAAPRIALVFCPYFSLRSPHLGLSRIFTMLKHDGLKADVYDLDDWLRVRHREWYHSFERALNIGREFDRVSFVLGIEALLHHLFSREHDRFDWDGVIAEALIKPIPGFQDILREAADPLVSGDYDIVLFSTYISNVFFSLSVAQVLKHTTNARIVFGGPGSSIPETARFFLHTGFVDAVVIGEGELTISELFREWDGQGSVPGIPGVARLSNDAFEFKPREQIRDISNLPVTQYPALDSAISYFPMETSRGCIMDCGFCSESSFWNNYRPRSIESIRYEIATRSRSLDNRMMTVEFVDSLLNPSETRLRDVCEGIIDEGRAIRWICEMRPVSWMTSSLASLMYRAGCRNVSLGAETCIPGRLNYLRKGTRVEWILDTIDALTEAGIQTTVYRMVGISGETDHEILEMYELLRSFMHRINDPVQWGRIRWGSPDVLRVEPYSPMYRDPEKWNIQLSPFTIPLPEDLAYLSPYVDPLCVTADNDIPKAEKLRHNALMKKLDIVTGLMG